MGAGYETIMVLTSVYSARFKRSTEQDARRLIYEDAKINIKRVVGLLVLSFRLIFNVAREEKNISDLVTRGVITKEEEGYFLTTNANTMGVTAIILSIIHELSLEGKVSDSNLLILNNCIMSIRSNASNISMYLDVQLPYPFIQIVTAVAYAFLIQLIMVCSSYVSNGVATGDRAFLVTGYLTIILYNFVLLGLLRLFEVLSNPMGHDAADFPGDTYMRNYEKNLNGILRNSLTVMENNGILGPIASGVANNPIAPLQFRGITRAGYTMSGTEEVLNPLNHR